MKSNQTSFTKLLFLFFITETIDILMVLKFVQRFEYLSYNFLYKYQNYYHKVYLKNKLCLEIMLKFL